MSDIQEALDGYDKEWQGQAKLDREDRLLAAAMDVIVDYNRLERKRISPKVIKALAKVILDVRLERRKMLGVP